MHDFGQAGLESAPGHPRTNRLLGVDVVPVRPLRARSRIGNDVAHSSSSTSGSQGTHAPLKPSNTSSSTRRALPPSATHSS
jgi:hypothetical protein